MLTASIVSYRFFCKYSLAYLFFFLNVLCTYIFVFSLLYFYTFYVSQTTQNFIYYPYFYSVVTRNVFKVFLKCPDLWKFSKFITGLFGGFKYATFASHSLNSYRFRYPNSAGNTKNDLTNLVYFKKSKYCRLGIQKELKGQAYVCSLFEVNKKRKNKNQKLHRHREWCSQKKKRGHTHKKISASRTEYPFVP